MSESAATKEPSNQRFSKGEQIPLKGVWFVISDITAQSLVLTAVSTTNKHKKWAGAKKKRRHRLTA